MTTVIIDTQSDEARRIVEFLKSTTYAKVIEEKVPNKETIKAMKDLESGNINHYASAKDLMEKLKKEAGV